MCAQEANIQTLQQVPAILVTAIVLSVLDQLWTIAQPAIQAWF